MEIIFDSRPGEIYDIFASLWLMNNYEYAVEIERKNGSDIDTKYRKMIYSIIKNESIDMANIKRYFYRELEPSNILSIDIIWKYPTIDKYLEYLRNIDDHEIRKKIIRLINRVVRENMIEEEIEKLALNDKNVLRYIEDKDIDIGLKWEIYLLLNNKQEYYNKFTDFIEAYLDTYKILDVERKKELLEFNNDFDKNIKESQLEFLNKFIDNLWKFDNYEKIYITSSVNMALSISHNLKEKTCHVIIGPDIKEVIKNLRGKDSIESDILFIKNIIEDTKFNIIKLLIKKEYYAQELAEAVGITKANTSYHMNSLISIGAVNVKKEGQRVYYSANKDSLRRSIQSLIKELEL